MKQVNHKGTDTKTEETTSNNKNNKQDHKALLDLKAGILVHSSKEIPKIHGFSLKLDDDPVRLVNNCRWEVKLLRLQ